MGGVRGRKGGRTPEGQTAYNGLMTSLRSTPRFRLQQVHGLIDGQADGGVHLGAAGDR